MLTQQDVDAREEAIRERIRRLSDDARKRYYALMTPRLKDPDTYAVLNFALVFGLHHFYLGRPMRALVEWGASALSVALMVGGDLWILGLLLLIGVIAVDLHDLFRAQIIVKHSNNERMHALLLPFEAAAESGAR